MFVWQYQYVIVIKVRVMVFNTAFNNISAISWQSVLLAEETGVHGENHRPVLPITKFVLRPEGTVVEIVYTILPKVSPYEVTCPWGRLTLILIYKS
jgi:hypothetical protein